ncbi:MAG: preprotein translocase subunit SecE [Bacillota bacterium]|nr:preprotein translocase subunit SecE [Bacillota bacterium]
MNFLQRSIRFVRDVIAELKKVVWPTRRETAVYTVVVLATVTVVAVAIWVFDLALSFLMGFVLPHG